MSNPSVYVETTVVGHIAARQQSDIVVAARQLVSNRWWQLVMTIDCSSRKL